MKKRFLGLIVVLVLIFAGKPALAADPEIITRTKTLLSDATKWILGLIPLAGGLMIGYQALMKQFTDDDMMVAKHNKAMKNILIAGVIGMSAVGLVSAVLAYFV